MNLHATNIHICIQATVWRACHTTADSLIDRLITTNLSREVGLSLHMLVTQSPVVIRPDLGTISNSKNRKNVHLLKLTIITCKQLKTVSRSGNRNGVRNKTDGQMMSQSLKFLIPHSNGKTRHAHRTIYIHRGYLEVKEKLIAQNPITRQASHCNKKTR